MNGLEELAELEARALARLDNARHRIWNGSDALVPDPCFGFASTAADVVKRRGLEPDLPTDRKYIEDLKWT